MVHEENVITE